MTKKSVAIYGFAPQTRDLIHDSDAQEVWALNNFYNYGLPEERVTRTFEVHQLWMAAVYAKRDIEGHQAKAYIDWLRREHKFPVYMMRVREDYKKDLQEIKALDLDALTEGEKLTYGAKLAEIEIAFKFFDKDNKANIRRYPLEDIIDSTIPIIPDINHSTFPERGMVPYYISSIDYMSALAIYEQFDRIEYYGVELREKTEWAMQKSGATFWAGFARGRGIEVLVPRKSVLISAPLYGIATGAQMIPIQVPEELKAKLSMEFDRQRNIHNHLSGRYSEKIDTVKLLRSKGEDAAADEVLEAAKKLEREANQAYQRMLMTEGAINLAKHMINHENLDLEHLNLTMDSITRLEIIQEETEPEPAESEPDNGDPTPPADNK